MEGKKIGKVYGYARVSTEQQLLDIQIEQLKAKGIKEENIFSEKISGSTKIEERAELQKLLKVVQDGDEIVVTKFDRLSRSTFSTSQLLIDLTKKGVSIRSLEQGISTEGTQGRLVINILTAIAEGERERILERIKEGIERAKLNGVQFGRKRLINYDLVKKMRDEGQTLEQIASQFYNQKKGKPITKQAVYYILKEHNKEEEKLKNEKQKA